MNIASVSAANGLGGGQQRFDGSAARIATSHNPIDTVSLSTQAVKMIESKQESGGDLAALHISDEMEKTALTLAG